jgi:hypothetical protein
MILEGEAVAVRHVLCRVMSRVVRAVGDGLLPRRLLASSTAHTAAESEQQLQLLLENVHLKLPESFHQGRQRAQREWKRFKVQPTNSSLCSFSTALDAVASDAKYYTGSYRAWKSARLFTVLHPLLSAALVSSAPLSTRLQAARLWARSAAQVCFCDVLQYFVPHPCCMHVFEHIGATRMLTCGGTVSVCQHWWPPFTRRMPHHAPTLV